MAAHPGLASGKIKCDAAFECSGANASVRVQILAKLLERDSNATTYLEAILPGAAAQCRAQDDAVAGAR